MGELAEATTRLSPAYSSSAIPVAITLIETDHQEGINNEETVFHQNEYEEPLLMLILASL